MSASKKSADDRVSHLEDLAIIAGAAIRALIAQDEGGEFLAWRCSRLLGEHVLGPAIREEAEGRESLPAALASVIGDLAFNLAGELLTSGDEERSDAFSGLATSAVYLLLPLVIAAGDDTPGAAELRAELGEPLVEALRFGLRVTPKARGALVSAKPALEERIDAAIGHGAACGCGR